eukprot:TRINITY_DN9259_c0_g1_i3.p1 TRINITY_DN9259_c0_g1~~TRINITY_DN9259_c0_g1_i3.p1  ORF type:complete len:235 (-),score=44.79 TRINITY_DN9259_c0_g1_i3:238-942(-)
MVTASRLHWILEQLHLGRQCWMIMNTHKDKVIVKLRMPSEYDVNMQNGFAMMWVTGLLNGLVSAVTVDHGHSDSNGVTHVRISMKPSLQFRPKLDEMLAECPLEVEGPRAADGEWEEPADVRVAAEGAKDEQAVAHETEQDNRRRLRDSAALEKCIGLLTHQIVRARRAGFAIAPLTSALLEELRLMRSRVDAAGIPEDALNDLAERLDLAIAATFDAPVREVVNDRDKEGAVD